MSIIITFCERNVKELMAMNNRKLILFMSCLLEGYIAKPNNDLSFLNTVQKDGEDNGYNDFIATEETVIIGQKTDVWVMKQVGELPRTYKKAYFITQFCGGFKFSAG